MCAECGTMSDYECYYSDNYGMICKKIKCPKCYERTQMQILRRQGGDNAGGIPQQGQLL